ncbi:hypothetical protein SLEP1_g12976 [Rubroshorea leprosula]|uniref:SET domain-containing protein n=1 Tax=Rubroshorea leprosula TaxID=152421 RepID=A0AAV5INE9_9ROSI|nr:hypothetical protein SLEP1_g12976 [Rubroshorea leprosula]
MEQEQGELDSFLKWAAELGISDSLQSQNPSSCLGHSVIVSHFPHAGGRGLAAARDLRRGELVLRVPKSALLTSESVMKDESLSLALKSHPSLTPTQMLTVCLLYEINKGKSSWWHPYLIHLPRSYEILAAFGEFEVQALQVDYAVWAAKKAVTKAKSQWKEARKLMEELKFKPKLLTLRAWLWASGTISSRTLHIPWDEAGCLCPVGDLFNYAAPGDEPNGFENVDLLQNGDAADDMDAGQFDAPSWRLTDGGFEEDVTAYCFYARKNYKMGEQVLLSYGTYTNLELLEHYGFLLYENPNDKVFVPLEDDIYSSTSWPKDSLYIHETGKPSFALLSALRLWATPANQRRSVGQLAYSGSQLSLDNEISIMKWTSNNCLDALKSLPTSIEEDSLLLSAIEKFQDYDDPVEWSKTALSYGGEVCAFLEAFDQQNGKSSVDLVLSNRNRMLIDRWKLAVQWRLRYKKVLVDCISYCCKRINSLSDQGVSAQDGEHLGSSELVTKVNSMSIPQSLTGS